MDKEEWVLSELESMVANSQDYKQKALLKATIRLIKEQYKRISQMEGELDGKLWSPSNWSN
ncbi:hypothetical protein [Carnobacterium mobile]|uniref:hypothetical protein n=1 Tax=Carnobacterium mobile TaxID=2750 RepID=UPI000551BB48|nr:hypothetical protein [Carnobacterium mobile]